MKKKIALLEDDADIRETTATFLSANGFEVMAAASGHDLVGAVLAQPPDLVITDLILPGLPGETVMRTFRVQGLIGSVPLIVISGQRESVVRAAAEALGAAAYFCKPFDLKLLLAKARALTGAAPPTPHGAQK